MPETRTVKGFAEDGLPFAEGDFECRTFDLSDNSPYISSVIPAPEECKKNTQERYEIVKSEPAQSPVRRTFSADETAGASNNFESAPLWPRRYRFVICCDGIYFTLLCVKMQGRAGRQFDKILIFLEKRKKPIDYFRTMC